MSRKLKGGAIVDASVTSTQIDPAIINKITDAYNQANTALSTGGSGSAQANLAYATANLAYSQANAAYGKANAGTTIAENAYGQANNAYAAANNAAVRVSANSGTSISANTISFNNTSTITVTVTGSGANANIEFTAVGGAAYDQANAGYAQANTARTTANDAYAQANAAYGQANTARDTANNAYNNSNTKFSTSGGSISGDVTISGNLVVQGNATTINVSNLAVNDSIILLATGSVGDADDIGFVGHIQRDATNTHVGLIRKATENRFYLFDNYEIEPTNNVIDIASNNFRVANLRLNTINANSFVTSEGLDITGQANAAFNQANAAYAQANTARTTANDAYGQANTARDTANASYGQANNAFGAANVAYNTANSAANTVRVSQNGASTLSARQLNFVNTANVTITVTDSGNGNANVEIFANTGTSSGSNTNIINQSFVAANGNGNLTYSLTYTPWGIEYVEVYKNGIFMTPTVDFTVSGNTVTVVPAGETNDDIDVRYFINTSLVPESNTTIFIDANTVAAQTNTFTLSQNVSSINRLAVSKNGLRLTPTSHYTLTNNNTVTLAAVAEVGDLMLFEYFFNIGGVVDLAAYGQANAAYGQANAAYGQANAAYGAANNTVLKAGDTMTGQLNISAGGLSVTGNSNFDSGTLFVDSVNDRIGIGTTNPGRKLHVTTTGSDIATFNGANTGFVIQDNASGLNQVELVGYRDNDSSYNDILLRGSAVGLFINGTTGNVGIGTTSPGQKLEVAGNIYVNTSGNPYLELKTSGAGNNPYVRLRADTNYWDIQSTFSNSNDELLFMYNGSTKLTIDLSGNVGIGTTSPGAKLHVSGGSTILNNASGSAAIAQSLVVAGNGNADNSGPFISFQTEALSETIRLGGIRRSGSWGIDIMNTSSTSLLFVRSDGNVGIGTTNPSVKLHVHGGTDEGGLILAGRSDWTNGSGEYAVGRITGRNIGAGVNSTQIKLDGDNLTGSIGLWTASAGTLGQRMVILGSGYVGIGTHNPSGRLHIQASSEIGAYIRQAVADNSTRDGIYLYEDSGQATGKQAVSWYNGNQSYYKARIWTEVGSDYAATKFGIDVANDARTVANRFLIRNGYVTTPSQPFAVVSRGGTWSTTGATIVFDVVFENVGSHYNSGTGIFTCPVAGVYMISVMLMTAGTDTTLDMQLMVNGTVNQRFVPYNSATGGAYNQVSGVTLITCAANDTLAMYLNSGNVYGQASGRHGCVVFRLLG